MVQVRRGTGGAGRRPAAGLGATCHREACRGVHARRSRKDVSGVLDVLVSDAEIKLSMRGEGDGGRGLSSCACNREVGQGENDSGLISNFDG